MKQLKEAAAAGPGGANAGGFEGHHAATNAQQVQHQVLPQPITANDEEEMLKNLKSQHQQESQHLQALLQYQQEQKMV
jgi:hypothetical protein